MESISNNISVLKSAIVNTNLDRVQELLNQQPLAKDHEDNQDLLIAAIKVGNVEIIKLLLKHGCTLATSNTTTSHLPLCLAVESENLEMIQVLLASGASVIKKDFHCKKTPLQKAFDLALSNKDFKIVDLMLSAYDVENTDVHNDDEIIHFYIACIRNKTKLVENVIKKGVNVNIHLDYENDQWHGSTALHYAAKYQSLQVIELLLENSADVLYQDSNMQSPLHLAFLHLMSEYHNEYARDKAEEIIDLILSTHDDDIFNPTDMEYGVSHFHIACMRNNTSIVENYLQNGIDVNAPVKCINDLSFTWFQNTPLHFAAISCKKDLIKLLIEHGADVNANNKCGLTPLWLLFDNQPKYSKIKNFIEYCRSKNKLEQNGKVKNEISLINLIINEFEYVDCIMLLVESGSNLNYTDQRGKPLLFELYDSTVNNFINKQNILGVYGTDDIPNICSEYLLFVIEETLDVLKKYGIDLESRDVNGNSIFHCIACSVKSNQVIDLAMNVAEIMQTFGVDPNVQNENGEIPINIATANGSLEFVELLLKFNVNPNSSNKMSQTPLDAVFSDHYEDDVLRSKMIDLLIKHGANVVNRNSDGETVLFKLARSDYYLSSMKSILQANCIIDAQDYKGETALFVAVLQNNHQGTKLLLDHGADINIKDYNGASLMEKLFLCNLYSDYVNQTYLLMLEILEMHIRKLKLTNCHVSHSNLVNCKRLKFAYFYQPHLNTVKDLFEDEKDLDVDVSCKDRLLNAELNKEIQKMMIIKIDSETSLYDILFKHPLRISKHLENKYFQKCMSKELLCSQFPYFGHWLFVKFKQGLERCACLDDVLKSLKCIIGKNFPNSYLYSITLHLNNRDLKNLLSIKL